MLYRGKRRRGYVNSGGRSRRTTPASIGPSRRPDEALAHASRRARRRRPAGPARQRIVGVLVEATNAVAVETRLVDLERGAEQQFGIELLDGEADRLRGRIEATVSHRPAAFAAAARKQLGGCAVIE